MKSAFSPFARWCLLLAFVLLCRHVSAQVVTLVATVPSGGGTGYSTQEIDLAASDSAEILSQHNEYSQFAPTGVVEVNTKVLPINLFWKLFDTNPVQIHGVTYAGPAKIKAAVINADAGSAGKVGLLTVRVTRANAIPTVTPLNAAVIPSDATGNFSVILESSTDMVTWTPANPGSYSSTIQKRFFRVRIVKL
jgi:hypothetical protein